MPTEATKRSLWARPSLRYLSLEFGHLS